MKISKGTLYDYLQHQQGIRGGTEIILSSRGHGAINDDVKRNMKENSGPLDAGSFIDTFANKLANADPGLIKKVKSSSYAPYLKQKCEENGADFDGVVAIIIVESSGNVNAVKVHPKVTYEGIFQINNTYGVNGFDPIASIDWYFDNRKKNINYRKKKGINDDGSFVPNSGSSELETKQIDDLKKKINLDAFLLHHNSLELQQVDVSWGSRVNASEYSDWIGLKQFLLYLIKTYTPHKMVPFVELIPKFTVEGNAKLRAIDLNAGDTENLSDIQTSRYNDMVDVYNYLQDSGGIDIMTQDPFLDYLSYGEDERGLSLRTVGNLTFNAAGNTSTTSKPGGVGVKSIKVEMGDATHQGLSMVTIVMEDISGNKFLDPASPWSFILNKHQYGGDFFFRFGWQVEFPPESKHHEDTGYKLWNHEGWKLFDTDLKKKIQSKLQTNNYTLNLTHSLREKSLFYNGWQIVKGNDGNTGFVKELITNTEEANVYYMSLNMLMPTIAVDPVTGSITATMVFQTTSDMANFMAPIQVSEWTKKLVKEAKNNTVSLYNLIIAFMNDNENHINSIEDEREKQKLLDSKAKKPKNDSPEERSQLIQVIPLEDYKSGMIGLSLIDPKDVNIVISNDRLKELEASSENNNTLWSWIISVTGDNHLRQVPTSNSQSGTFNFLLDNGADKLSESGFTVLDANQVAQATGYLTQGDYQRLLSDDDVFSFRFQGTLIESLTIESTDEETLQSIDANVDQAEADLLNAGLTGNVNREDASDGNAPKNDVPLINDLNKQIGHLHYQSELANEKLRLAAGLDSPLNPNPFISYETAKYNEHIEEVERQKKKQERLAELTEKYVGIYNQNLKKYQEHIDNNVLKFGFGSVKLPEPTNPYNDYLEKLRKANKEKSTQSFVGAKELMQKAVSVALSFKGQTEVPDNTGSMVNMFQTSTGNVAGQPWCMSFVYYCYKKASDDMNIKCPLIKTGLVESQWTGINAKFKTRKPSVGALCIFKWKNGGDHVGIVTSVAPGGEDFTTIDGNTGNPVKGKPQGVFEKNRNIHKNVVGFISFAELTNEDAESISTDDMANSNNPYLIRPVKTNTLDSKIDMLKVFLSRMRNVNVKMIGHPWLQLGRSFYIKGTGNFDGKYFYSKIEHTIENNMFTTNAYGVSIIFNDDLYNEFEAQRRGDTLQNSTALENVAEKVTSVPEEKPKELNVIEEHGRKIREEKVDTYRPSVSFKF